MSNITDPAIDHQVLIVKLIEYFIECEGTDYLGENTNTAGDVMDNLTQAESDELTRLRDQARRNQRWIGY